MDPNIFAIDWERTIEVLGVIVLLAFFLERALAPFFESRYFIANLDKRSLKEVIAFLLGFLICWWWKFDAVSILLVSGSGSTSFPGYALTGAIIAGGSKASLRLFRDILGLRSKALQEAEDQDKQERAQPPGPQKTPPEPPQPKKTQGKEPPPKKDTADQ